MSVPEVWPPGTKAKAPGERTVTVIGPAAIVLHGRDVVWQDALGYTGRSRSSDLAPIPVEIEVTYLLPIEEAEAVADGVGPHNSNPDDFSGPNSKAYVRSRAAVVEALNQHRGAENG